MRRALLFNAGDRVIQVMGKLLIVFGFVIVAVGVLLAYSDRIPFIGKLPGDITIKKENLQFYFPITTSIVISLLVTGILWAISFMNKK